MTVNSEGNSAHLARRLTMSLKKFHIDRSFDTTKFQDGSVLTDVKDIAKYTILCSDGEVLETTETVEKTIKFIGAYPVEEIKGEDAEIEYFETYQNHMVPTQAVAAEAFED
jgi:hypothetical protein